MPPHSFGRRGGTSANAGRRASKYEATLPDGTVVRKRSYQVHQDTAHLGCYQHEGKWYTSGVRAEPQDWPGQQWVECRRVS